ncbi:hypothetical protein ONZ45_g18903 [Pleurotus djamor]|nr:hypothetical protein ONZ45_g18903 [Pleurotus djamor]
MARVDEQQRPSVDFVAQRRTHIPKRILLSSCIVLRRFGGGMHVNQVANDWDDIRFAIDDKDDPGKPEDESFVEVEARRSFVRRFLPSVKRGVLDFMEIVKDDRNELMPL